MNWTSQMALSRDSDAYAKLVFAVFGVYIWEIFHTSNFEWSLITRKRKFVWPMVIFFFLCRYCVLCSLIGLIISLSMSTEINCQALYTFNAWAGNMSILCASTSLMLRTLALWERKLKVLLPLGLLCLAHWVLLWRGMFVIKAQYDPSSESCEVVSTNHIFLNISFFMTMGVDFIIFVLTLAVLIPGKSRTGRLWKLLFTDGLVYFLIAFMCNMIPAILNVLDLNAVMNIIATVPAATFSAIAACRAVIRLQDFKRQDIYIHSTAQVMPRAPANCGSAATHSSVYSVRGPGYRLTRPEVHVTTNIVMESFSLDPAPENKQAEEFDDKQSYSDPDYIGTAV